MLLRSECGDRERNTFKDAVTSRGKREEEIAEKTEKMGERRNVGFWIPREESMSRRKSGLQS